jgi:hypothetical protein
MASSDGIFGKVALKLTVLSSGSWLVSACASCPACSGDQQRCVSWVVTFSASPCASSAHQPPATCLQGLMYHGPDELCELVTGDGDWCLCHKRLLLLQVQVIMVEF